MTPQDKYQKIMEVMSDKTESLGCMIKHWDKIIIATWEILKIDRRKYKIIWHPLRLWDVLYWIEKNWDNEINWMTTLWYIWQDKRKSLQPEDTELIDYIYNILP